MDNTTAHEVENIAYGVLTAEVGRQVRAEAASLRSNWPAFLFLTVAMLCVTAIVITVLVTS
jgi:uncharacterized membrane protein AbrB (regulator of aidB expression)